MRKMSSKKEIIEACDCAHYAVGRVLLLLTKMGCDITLGSSTGVIIHTHMYMYYNVV